MDRYKTMTTFVQVVRRGSLTDAARALGVSRALVSRQITDIERRLRVRLLNRSTRSVSLTEAGKSHFEFCNRTLAALKSEEASLLGQDRDPEGTLAVIAPKWIGNLDIADAMTSFSATYPKLKIEFVLGGVTRQNSGFLENGFDVVLRTRDFSDPSMRTRRIATLKFAACASPDYLAGHKKPAIPMDLADHACLVHVQEPSWRFVRSQRTTSVTVQAAFSSNAYLVLRKAALKGLGVALLPRRLVEQDLAQGALVRVLPRYPSPERPLVAAYAPGRNTPQKIRCFVEFIAKWYRG